MKNFIIRFWWIFPTLFAAAILSFFILLPTSWASTLWTTLSLMTFVAMIASWMFLIIFKKWWKCLFSFILAALTVTCFLYIFSLAMEQAFNPGPDNFGKEHPIPTGLDYNIPLEEREELPCPVDSTIQNTWLQIWNDFQGGMYTYDFHYPEIEEGEIFLRCYEATKNKPLSSKRIAEASKVAVPSTTSFSKLVEGQSFTIYPGDWGDYYAARIEVWHRDAKTGNERKLMEKVYRVEGWQR